MLAKQYMNSDSLCQHPTLILPAHQLDQLEDAVSLQAMPRKKLSESQVKEFQKTAKLSASNSMMRASQYLQTLCENSTSNVAAVAPPMTFYNVPTVEDRFASANQLEMDPNDMLLKFAPKKISVANEKPSFPADNIAPASQADGLPPAVDDEDDMLSNLLPAAEPSQGKGRGRGRGKGRGRGGCAVKSKAKAKSSPQATVAQAPDSQIESAGKDIYKAGDFNAKRLAYVKEKRKEGLSGQEAQTAWMHSDERADLVAGLSYSEQKRRKFC